MNTKQIKMQLEGVLERAAVPRRRTFASFLLTEFSRASDDRPIKFYKNTAPIDPRVIDLTTQLEYLIKAGLVYSKGENELKWLLLPTQKLLLYIDRYKKTLSGRVAVSEDRIDRLEKRFEGLAKYLIDKVEPPFTEEKLNRVIAEFEDQSKW